MSRIKKAVLFLFAVAVLTLVSLNAYATGGVKLGGTFINSDDATFKLAIDNSVETGKWQRGVEVDYMYQTQSDVETTNELYVNTKLIYTFAPKHYIVNTS